MQTFLPSADFDESAKVLDNKRLHKQALEAWQILMVLTRLNPEGEDREPKGWVNHPAVKMWQGNERRLFMYAVKMAKEWIRRGFNTTLVEKLHATFEKALVKNRVGFKSPNNWIEDKLLLEQVTSSHRLALLAKNYEWYSQFGWPEDPGHPISEYEYVWPVN
jgi:phage gp29-like protein